MLPECRNDEYQYAVPKFDINKNEDMGNPNGALIFDDSGFVKKGNDSVGVAKQYSGNV